MPTQKMQQVVRFTTGQSWIASSMHIATRELSRSWKLALCRKRYLCIRNHTSTIGRRARSELAGHIRQKITESGPNLCTSGYATPSSDMDEMRWTRGTGKCGMNPTFFIGTERRKNISNCTTLLLTP